MLLLLLLGEYEKAFELLEKMTKYQIQKDVVTYTAVGNNNNNNKRIIIIIIIIIVIVSMGL